MCINNSDYTCTSLYTLIWLKLYLNTSYIPFYNNICRYSACECHSLPHFSNNVLWWSVNFTKDCNSKLFNAILHILRLRKNDEVLAAHWWLLGKQKFLFLLCLLKYIFKLHFDNKNKSYKTPEAPGEAFKAKFEQKSAIWKAGLGRKIISIESSRNIKFTHNVD